MIKHAKDALHMYAKKEPAMKGIKFSLNDVPNERCTRVTNNKVSDDSKDPLTLM